jgi:hypothetical protein
MTSRFGLLLAGLFCLFSAYRLTVVSLAPDAPEMKGWLLRQFGQQGVAGGTAALGVLMLAIGLILMARTIRRKVAEQRAIRNSGLG